MLAAALVSFLINGAMRKQHTGNTGRDKYTIDFPLFLSHSLSHTLSLVRSLAFFYADTYYILLLMDAFARRGTSCSESCPTVTCNTACFSSNVATLLKQFELILCISIRINAIVLK